MYIYFLIIIISIIIIVSYNISRKKKKTLLKPSNVLKFKVKSQDPMNNLRKKEMEMNFEIADLHYYNTQPKSYPNYGTFTIHQPEPETNIPNIMVPLNEVSIMNDFNNYIYDEIIDVRDDPIVLPPPIITVQNVDTQNVHESNIGKGVRKIFGDVELQKQSDFDKDVLIKEILEYSKLTSVNNEIKKQNIRKVLDTVKSRNSKISNVNDATELELLATVWKVACDASDETSTNIKDMLMTQLSDAVEYNNVLCPTGVVSRISTALVVENPDLFPKTKSMLNEEIMNIASNLRNKLEKDSTYINLDDRKKSTEFKTKLIEKLEKDYEGILTKDDIKDSTKDWIDLI